MLARIGDAYGVKLTIATAAPSPPAHDEARLAFDAPELAGLQIVSTISRKQLDEHLARVDELTLLASGLSIGGAVVAAMWLARRLARPLEALADQAAEVVRGEPRPVSARGGGREMEAFARAFNKALEDLVQLRKRLAPPTTNWDARHMATAYFEGLEGDVRVDGDTIVVTYYNARDADRLREHYEDLPAKLRAEKIDPRVPWLYGFELDFRFR